MARKKEIKLQEEADSEILIADTNSGNQVRLATWRTIFRRKNEVKNSSSGSKPQQKSPQQTLASEITNSSALPCVFFSRPRKGQTMWVCAWCLVCEISQKVNL
jgi:hypothetical protein